MVIKKTYIMSSKKKDINLKIDVKKNIDKLVKNLELFKKDIENNKLIKSKNKQTKKKLNHNIRYLIETNISKKYIMDLKTKYGNTQKIERLYIEKIKNIFDNNNITYKTAPSQQSKDFREINGTSLNLEIKKTDTTMIKFNCTCPNENIEYLIIVTGNNKYKPQLLFVNGSELIENSIWSKYYKTAMESVKDIFCRGKSKKELCSSGIMSAYARPNYDANISMLLKKH